MAEKQVQRVGYARTQDIQAH